jgi:hypothetical protein
MWTVEGQTFDKYYKAFDYAMFLYNTENRQITVTKQGQSEGILVGDPIESDDEINY